MNAENRTTPEGCALWRQRNAELAEAYRRLPRETRDALVTIARDIRRIKVDLQRIADTVAAGDICSRCGGACCRSGRYHVTVTDILVYLSGGEAPPEPPFAAGACPYLAAGGCIFPPEFRPFNCIIFSCEHIEDALAPQSRAGFCRLVESLREMLRSADLLLAGKVRTGTLLD